MDDAAAVRRGERVGDRPQVLERFARRNRTGLQPLAERAAFEELGHRVRGVAFGADVVERDDVGMGQRGDGPGFAFEPGERLRIAGQLRGQNLIATSRPRRVSRARKTSPMPPRPRGATSS